MSIYWVAVINSLFKYLGHQDGNISEVFGDFHYSGVPFFSSLIIFSCVLCFTTVFKGYWSVDVVIPIHSCKLPSPFVHLVTTKNKTDRKQCTVWQKIASNPSLNFIRPFFKDIMKLSNLLV